MALISYFTVTKIFANDNKLLQRGENALRSGHMESCLFDTTTGIITGKVHASMKDRLYNVEVYIALHKSVIFAYEVTI